MNRWLLYILTTVFLTGCTMNYFQPPPDAWASFYKHKRGDMPFEVVKKDMLACGFENPYSSYIPANDEHGTQYIKAMLCMESKGYRNESVQESTICMNPSRKDKPACQNRSDKPSLDKITEME